MNLSPTNPGDIRQELSSTYHLVQIREGEVNQTALSLPVWVVESRVMPFRLSNTKATSPFGRDESLAEE